VKFHWLLSSFLGVFLLTGAAEAARLQSWRFDTSENRLYITTEGGVQPKAQLIFNPTRLVIDLPGTSLGRQSVNQAYSGAIESVRVGQFDGDTTRIVVELKDGFTIDPSQVKFRGISPSEWTVDLPTPVRAANSSSEPGGERLTVESSAPSEPTAEATVVQNVQLTADGFLIRTAGGRPQINFQQSRAGDIATLDIEGATLAPGLSNQQPQTNGKHGVERIEVRQLPTEPPTTRVTLRMKSSNTQWRASLSSLGGISLIPAGVRPSTTPRRLTVDPPLRSSISALEPPLAQQNRNPISWPRTNTGTTDLPQISNSRRVVVIDPGHGGRDPGAVGIGGIREKDIVLDVSFQVARLLEQQGVQAVMSRTDDSEIDLEPRVSLAERLNATLFVSIHANAINMSRPDISGIETYYYGSGLDLARTIHASILDGTGASDRRVRQARFFVLRKTSMPSVLLEIGFVTGAEDAARLSDPAYRSQMAASIARGILLYLQQR
jgi:N-acetylmuramoyl-L-alanine amidase